MNETVTITDYDGAVIKVGTKVRFYDIELPPEDDQIGKVIEITDFDGDVDDDTGRSRMVPPDVIIEYPDGSHETFPTSEWTFHEVGMVMTADGPEPEGMEATGKVEELMVVQDG